MASVCVSNISLIVLSYSPSCIAMRSHIMHPWYCCVYQPSTDCCPVERQCSLCSFEAFFPQCRGILARRRRPYASVQCSTMKHKEEGGESNAELVYMLRVEEEGSNRVDRSCRQGRAVSQDSSFMMNRYASTSGAQACKSGYVSVQLPRRRQRTMGQLHGLLHHGHHCASCLLVVAPWPSLCQLPVSCCTMAVIVPAAC